MAPSPLMGQGRRHPNLLQGRLAPLHDLMAFPCDKQCDRVRGPRKWPTHRYRAWGPVTLHPL
jgi:hypothetical protein